MGDKLRNTGFRFSPKYHLNYIVIIIVMAVFSAMSMGGGLKRSMAQLLTQIAYSIILAVSLNLVVGFLGDLSLGHAGFMCVGAYIGW